ncbi:MAG: tRNA 2-thiouridine(34) synthase MnmA [Rhodospirillales bacterium]|jgi:tRNA-specific 2-thiouridylase|nr:tRNA 2-thiouridine(34) synthase MnmA [Rhodospirillales bacterium]
MDLLELGKDPAQARIVVAMSGGVDSSAAAAMVARAGYETIGVTLRLYDAGAASARPGTCCAGRDVYDARRVADSLGIPHYVLDYEDRFRAAVIEDFADAYARGETPIPCVRCNQRIKFRDLLGTARELGADALVTGHYAQIEFGPDGPELHRGAEAARDQSYFLFATTREQMAVLRFPLGSMEKARTRELATQFGLRVADKRDSQDICFVADGSYARVVEAVRPGAAEEGAIVDLGGTVLGRHAGIINFTVGQRRGLGLGGRCDDAVPLYVIRLEAESRRVVVGPGEALFERGLKLRGVNWLGEDEALRTGSHVTVKIRSAAPAVPAIVRGVRGGGAEVTFEEPQAGVAPGQACVFYDGTRVLGGGWIERDAAARAA